MAPEYLTCPFCGFEFAKADTLCHHGCPLGAMCHLIRCPNCQYEFPEQPQTVSWLESLFRRPKREPGLPDHFRSVRELKPGERATVLCLGAGGPSRNNNLAVFGLVPGAEVTLIQQHPTPVVRVGETELALDADIARGILVERLANGSAAA